MLSLEAYQPSTRVEKGSNERERNPAAKTARREATTAKGKHRGGKAKSCWLPPSSDPLPFFASASASGGPAPPASKRRRSPATRASYYSCFWGCDQGDGNHHQAPIITSTSAAPTACARGAEEKVEVAKDW
ncbi:hypothetical protein GUJ93_ZPchr0012g19716 [Zizania palustris]|uniref:Uncharacterized protein n=1 Tax=Zizania palustris TaxID=103762 RepID=A0A8J5WP66_ZIZPA|nr:hypothetical protein GUJ93_ZPchr0012g19716 [Zizania palustris]